MRISLCMIVKDEETNLAACLDSVTDLVDEVLIVDTGSVDGTKQVASRCGARMIDFPWQDDFSAARNEGLRHATGEWIFWLDADERLDAANRRKLQTLFSSLQDEKTAYVMRQLSPTGDPYGSEAAVDQVRLFRRDPALRWDHRVHEQILPAVRQASHEVRRTDIVIGHHGYRDPRQSEAKLRRNLLLLERERAERPEDPTTLYHLGLIYERLGRVREALPLFRRSLELIPPNSSLRPHLYAGVGRGQQHLGDAAAALATYQEARREHPDDVGLLFQEAVLRHAQGDEAGAEACLVHLFKTPPNREFLVGDPGRHGYKAHHLLAQVYQRQKRWTEAELQLRKALAERPSFLPAWNDLAEVYLHLDRWADAETVARRLEPYPAALLRARVLMAQQAFPAARTLLEVVVADSPRAVWPRVLLSRALLQQEGDWHAAEQALGAVLSLDPQNQEARHNLDVLRRRLEASPRGHPSEQAAPQTAEVEGALLQATAEIEKLGGSVAVGTNEQGTAVYFVDLHERAVQDADLIHLRGLTPLHTLHLGQTRISDVGLIHLEGRDDLRALLLNRTSISDSGLGTIPKLAALQELDVSGTTVTDVGLERLRGHPHLRSVDLGATRVTDAGMTCLCALPHLEALGLAGTQVSDACLELLKRARGLRTLNLADGKITNAGLIHLGEMSGLQTLWLQGCQINDASFPGVANLRQLQHLGLRKTGVGNAFVEALQAMTELRVLDLSHTQVTTAGLVHLKALQKLETLDLSGTRIDDAALECLRELKPLRQLYLRETKVGDAGLAHLADLTDLTVLDLWQTGVGDPGLVHLHRLPRLRVVGLGRTKVTPAGVEALRQVMPEVQVREETIGQLLWRMFEGLLTVVGLLPLDDPDKLARSVAADPDCVRRPVNEHTRDRLLHLAAAQGKRVGAELLLRHGAEVNAAGERGRTPLHQAAAAGHLEIVRLLVEHGAKVEVLDEDGETPFSAAVGRGARECARFLAQHGADIDLNAAICLGELQRVRDRLAGNPNAYRQARKPNDLLPDALRFLIREEIARCGDKPDPARVAGILEEARPVIELLLSQGADPNGPRVWEEAVQLPDVAIARLLLERGGDPDRGGFWKKIVLTFLANGEEMRALLADHQGAATA